MGDGGDFPLVLADVDGTLLLASDPDVLRGMVRRASGDGEPGLAGTRVGRLSGGMTSRGLGLTVNLSAAADALEAFRFLATEDDGTDVLFNRVLNTLRVVNGFAWHATVDSGGVLVESVSTFDARLAQEVGEEELLELLTCATCQLGDPTLLPQDAVALSGGMLPLGAFVDWVDSWLASVSDIGGVPEGWDLRTALAELLGIDADVAALGWLGDSWHAATLGVLDTDLRGWVQGLPTLITIPVSSEQAAREGLDQWPTLLRSLGDLTEDMGAGTEMDGFFRPQDAVSVRESAYRGIPYTRYRTGPAVDVGVAVFGADARGTRLRWRQPVPSMRSTTSSTVTESSTWLARASDHAVVGAVPEALGEDPRGALALPVCIVVRVALRHERTIRPPQELLVLVPMQVERGHDRYVRTDDLAESSRHLCLRPRNVANRHRTVEREKDAVHRHLRA